MGIKTGPDAGQESEPIDGAHAAPPAPGPVHSQNPSSNSQLRFFQLLSLLLFIILAGGAAYYAYRQRHIQPITILVSGKPITTVADYAAANALIGKIAASKIGAAYSESSSPRVTEPIVFQHVAGDSPLDSEEAASAKLAAATHLTVLADVILIQGHPSVALPDKDMAQAALDAVRQHYADMPPNDTVIDKPTFQEKVTIERQRVPSTMCLTSADQAAQRLLTPPQAKTYTVQQHETGWKIARQHHLSFTDFIRANSGRDLDHLAPGDTVNISQTFPPLTVIVRKETSKTESIVPGASAENAGERQVTSITTYINGVRTGESTPVGVYTLKRAAPRRSIQ